MSQAGNLETVYTHPGVIRGHLVYKSMWISVLEVLLLVCEEINEYNQYAVCVRKGERIGGHVPMELS